jgi:hypothetical protein
LIFMPTTLGTGTPDAADVVVVDDVTSVTGVGRVVVVVVVVVVSLLEAERCVDTGELLQALREHKRIRVMDAPIAARRSGEIMNVCSFRCVARAGATRLEQGDRPSCHNRHETHSQWPCASSGAQDFAVGDVEAERLDDTTVRVLADVLEGQHSGKIRAATRSGGCRPGKMPVPVEPRNFGQPTWTRDVRLSVTEHVDGVGTGALPWAERRWQFAAAKQPCRLVERRVGRHGGHFGPPQLTRRGAVSKGAPIRSRPRPRSAC